MLIPKKQGGNKNKLPEWIDKRRIKKEAKKKDSLSEKTKNLISKYGKTSVKQIPYSYVCPGCTKSFNASLLQKQIVEAARRNDSYISCPECGVALVIDKLVKVSTQRNSKINRGNLVSVYKNQGIVPAYTPQSWVDRALLEKICHELGKYCQKFGFFNPQLRFQRGITRGSIKEGGPQNVREAEYSIEAVDNLDLRFRVLATAGITPAGKVVLPTVFSTLDGREIPFTKEAVADFLSGKLFAATEPKINAPEIHFKERDFTRFREVVASKKTAGFEGHLHHAMEILGYGRNIYEIGNDEKGSYLRVEDLDTNRYLELGEQLKPDFNPYYDAGDVVLRFNPVEKLFTENLKFAAGIPTPGQNIEYQGKIYTIDSVTGDASVLTDETGVKTAPIPNTDLNIQAAPGVVTTPGAVAPIPTTTLAEKVKNLIKRSLRDEKTLVPFTESDPDYSVAKQTDVDTDFSVPYEKSNQGILPEDERAIQKMFRGGTSVKPTKSAAEVHIERIKEEILQTVDREGGVEAFVSAYGEPLLEGIDNWANYRGYELEYRELSMLEEFLLEKGRTETGSREGITKIAPEKAELERMVQKCMKDKGWSHGKCMNYVAGGVWHRKGKVASPAEGIAPFIYDEVMEKVKMGEVFENVKKDIEEKHPGFILRKEDYDEAREKAPVLRTTEQLTKASIKKTAEPTGYHETDETGKQIPISRLRTLINDYARAGQFPPDFDLTKVMSEVSRMTRKELEEILDKKLKNQHYPVVHAKKKTANVSFSELNNLLQRNYGITFPENSLRMRKLMEYIDPEADLDDVSGVVDIWMEKTDQGRLVVGKKKTAQELYYEGETVNITDSNSPYRGQKGIISFISPEGGLTLEFPDGSKEPFSENQISKVARISQGKSVNEIIQKIRKAALTEKDVKEDIKDEIEGEKNYDQMAKEVECPKAEKALEDMADDEAEHAEELEEVVLPAVENTENYLEKYDSKKKSLRFAQEDVPLRRGDRVRTDSGSEGTIESVKHPMEQWPGEDLEYSVLLDGANIPLVYFPSQLTKISKKIAQEEETEEKPKTEYKTLKTKPHKPELEVEEAVVATPEMQKAFHEIKDHEQRLDEIKAIVNSARQKVEEEIRKVQEEHKSVEEAEEMSQAIEKLASLLEESEKKLVDAGEFFVWLDTSMKEKKFKASDKWRVEKLLEKFGEEAKKYLEKAEKGASSLNEDIKQRLLTVFPKREGSIERKADILDSIKELGTGLWEYIKIVSSILSEGEQLELVLE